MNFKDAKTIDSTCNVDRPLSYKKLKEMDHVVSLGKRLNMDDQRILINELKRIRREKINKFRKEMKQWRECHEI